MAAAPRTVGAYALVRPLAAEGSAERWIARPPPGSGLPGVVALKLLHGGLARQPEQVRRFEHEAKVLAGLESPHLPRLLDAGRTEDGLYIATAFTPGWTLRSIIDALQREGGPASATVASVIDLGVGLCRALDALHGARDPATGRPLGFVHRAVTPEHVELGEDGRARLVDLGLGTSARQDWETEAGVVLGRPGYLAPEQARGEPLDGRADVYAVGLVLFELLTLQPYIPRGPVPMMLRRQAAPEPRRPSELRPGLPPDIDAACARALAPEPERRFASARALAEALLAADEARAPAEGEMLSTLVGEMLWGELEPPEPGDGAVTQITERDLPGVEDSSMSFLLPTLAVPAPTVGVPPPAPAAVEIPPPEPTPLVRPAPPPRQGVPVVAVVALMLLTLGAGLGFGALVLGPSEVEPAPTRPTAPDSVAPLPAVVPAAPRAQASPRPATPAPAPAPPPPAGRPRRDAAPPPPTRAPAPPRDLEAELGALLRRSLKLGGGGEADALTSAIARERAAPKREAVDRLRRRLEALEAGRR